MIRLSRRITDTVEKSYGMCDKGAAFVPQEDLIHLELGRPYYDTPQHIKDATIRALQAGEVHYSDMHISIASLPRMAERTVSMFAFTKAYPWMGGDLDTRSPRKRS